MFVLIHKNVKIKNFTIFVMRLNFAGTGSGILLPPLSLSRRVIPSRKITLNSNEEVNYRELARRPWPLPSFCPGEAITEKWATCMCNPENLLFKSSLRFARPPFQRFSVLKFLFLSPNHKFLEILSSKASKFGKSSILRPQIGQKFSAQGYILLRNSFRKGPKFGSDLFTSPSVWSEYQNKS